MLFLLTWELRPGHGPKELDEILEIFSRWEPPSAYEISNFYLRADSAGGFATLEVDSSETFFDAIAPWAV